MNEQKFNKHVLAQEFNASIIDLGETVVTYSKEKIKRVISNRILQESQYDCYHVTQEEIENLADKELENLLKISKEQSTVNGSGPQFVN